MADDKSQTTSPPLNIECVGRAPNLAECIVVYLNREPTDSEFLAIHDALWKIVNEG
jgi:hypothetical protein